MEETRTLKERVEFLEILVKELQQEVRHALRDVSDRRPPFVGDPFDGI